MNNNKSFYISTIFIHLKHINFLNNPFHALISYV